MDRHCIRRTRPGLKMHRPVRLWVGRVSYGSSLSLRALLLPLCRRLELGTARPTSRPHMSALRVLSSGMAHVGLNFGLQGSTHLHGLHRASPYSSIPVTSTLLSTGVRGSLPSASRGPPCAFSLCVCMRHTPLMQPVTNGGPTLAACSDALHNTRLSCFWAISIYILMRRGVPPLESWFGPTRIRLPLGRAPCGFPAHMNPATPGPAPPGNRQVASAMPESITLPYRRIGRFHRGVV